MVVVEGNFELMVDPPVETVEFTGAFEQLVQQQLTLSNAAGYNLGWKIKCSDNNVIKIEPTVGLLGVGETASITVSSGPLPAPPSPQVIYIMNIPAGDDIPDAQAAWAQGAESGKVTLEVAFN